MRRLLAAPLFVFAFCFALLFSSAAEVDAKLINCAKWTSGRQAYGQCSGINTFLGFNNNQVVVVTICRRPWYLGGGSYQLAGDWVGRNTPSIATCAVNYVATDPVLWFR